MLRLAEGDWAFGYYYRDVATGAGSASLGDGFLSVDFTMPSPEYPLPRFGWIGSTSHPEYVLESGMTVINCCGLLRAGSGHPEGRPGRAHTTQKGLYVSGPADHCPAGDCWPVEKIDFKPVAK